MNTLQLAIMIIVLLSSLLLVIPIVPVQGSEGSVFFMKENSTAKIFANFTFPVLDNKTWNIGPSILGDIHDPNPLDSKYLTVTANSSSITANKNHVAVTYTITAKNNIKGVYSLFLYYCGLSPLAVGLNESDVNPAIFNEFFTAVYNCPAGSEDMPKMNFTGFSNMISKIINTNSNNTGSVDYMGPVGAPQPPLKQMREGVLLSKIKCNDDLNFLVRMRSDHSVYPACVKLSSMPRLENQGWMTLEKQISTLGTPLS